MQKFTYKEAERRLLEIIGSVETELITPEEAVIEFKYLKEYAAKSVGLNLTEYALADFQKIRTDRLSEYQYDDPEPSSCWEPEDE